MTDLYTDADGKLYLYLPETTSTTAVQTASGLYTGSTVTTADPAVSMGTLSPDTSAPVVLDVSPCGTGAALSGGVAITFSEAITSTGTVSLDGGSTSLPGGTWSAGSTVYTVPYADLSYGTTYTVTISGFKDVAGNPMIEDAAHQFTTLPNSDASLSGLTLSVGTLSPAFLSNIYAYAVSVDHNVSSLTVMPIAADANATIAVNGKTVANGATSDPISLSTGDNTVTITVAAQDGSSTQAYTVTVKRSAAVDGAFGPDYRAQISSGGTLPVTVNTAATMQRRVR